MGRSDPRKKNNEQRWKNQQREKRISKAETTSSPSGREAHLEESSILLPHLAVILPKKPDQTTIASGLPSRYEQLSKRND